MALVGGSYFKACWAWRRINWNETCSISPTHTYVYIYKHVRPSHPLILSPSHAGEMLEEATASTCIRNRLFFFALASQMAPVSLHLAPSQRILTIFFLLAKKNNVLVNLANLFFFVGIFLCQDASFFFVSDDVICFSRENRADAIIESGN